MSEEKEVTTQDNQDNQQIGAQAELVDRKKWELEKGIQLRTEYEKLYELWKSKDLIELEQKQEQVIQEGLKKYAEKLQEEQRPPTTEEIQQLLSQEYETFTVKLSVEDVNGESKEELFTLRELPQSAEIKFSVQFKDRLLKKSGQLEAIAQETVEQPFEKKLEAMASIFMESFDAIADTVVICLNPFGKKQHVTREWVQNNISSNRQWSIVEAQLKINRVKDFFLRLSRSGQQMNLMMSGQRFPALQTLVR